MSVLILPGSVARSAIVNDVLLGARELTKRYRDDAIIPQEFGALISEVNRGELTEKILSAVDRRLVYSTTRPSPLTVVAVTVEHANVGDGSKVDPIVRGE